MSNEINFGCSKGVSVELFLELLLIDVASASNS